MRRTRLENMLYIERVRQLCAKGLNRVQIAARLEVTHNAVQKVCRKHGISVVAVKGYESRTACFVKTACRATASSGSSHADN